MHKLDQAGPCSGQGLDLCLLLHWCSLAGISKDTTQYIPERVEFVVVMEDAAPEVVRRTGIGRLG